MTRQLSQHNCMVTVQLQKIYLPLPLVSHADTLKLNIKSLLSHKGIFLHRKKSYMMTGTCVSAIPHSTPTS